MKKKILIALICIIIAVVLVIVAFRVSFAINRKNNETNLNNNTAQENKVKENKTEENIIVENESKEENKIVENKVADTSNKNITDKVVPANQTDPTTGTYVAPSSAVYESTDIGSTDKKQQAIELVKKQWGEDNTVSFRCDSVTSEGEYIIAVISSESASVKNYFRVNINTKTVEVDY